MTKTVSTRRTIKQHEWGSIRGMLQPYCLSSDGEISDGDKNHTALTGSLKKENKSSTSQPGGETTLGFLLTVSKLLFPFTATRNWTKTRSLKKSWVSTFLMLTNHVTLKSVRRGQRVIYSSRWCRVSEYRLNLTKCPKSHNISLKFLEERNRQQSVETRLL